MYEQSERARDIEMILTIAANTLCDCGYGDRDVLLTYDELEDTIEIREGSTGRVMYRLASKGDSLLMLEARVLKKLAEVL